MPLHSIGTIAKKEMFRYYFYLKVVSVFKEREREQVMRNCSFAVFKIKHFFLEQYSTLSPEGSETAPKKERKSHNST